MKLLSMVLLLLSLSVVDSQWTGVCQAVYCDPSYLPYPNMNAALYGYDITKADPFSASGVSGGDPGWRYPIFVATTGSELGQGRVQLHTSIEARDVLQCSTSFEESAITNIKKYKKEQLKSSYSGYDLKIGNEVDVEVGVEVPLGASGAKGSASAKTTIPPFMTRSSSTTESEQNIQGFFSEEGGGMIKMEATCSVQVVDIVPNTVPLFNLGFANAVKKLSDATKLDESSKSTAFKNFINHYGTHYSQRTVMGSKLVYSMRFTKNERMSNTENHMSHCTKVTGLKIFGMQVEPNTEKCNKEDEYSESIKSSSVNRQSYATFGSKPATTLSEWSKQKFDKPMPLRMTLKPLPELFTVENLEAITEITKVAIDQEGMLDWFLAKWNNLCTEMNIPCKTITPGKSGCGYNDNCTFNQVCVPTNDEVGYKCELSNTVKLEKCNSDRHISTDIGGNDIIEWSYGDTVIFREEYNCCELCQATSGCVAYVWTTDENKCYLKNAIGTKSSNQICNTGIVKLDTNSHQCHSTPSMDSLGDDLYTIIVADQSQCCGLCQRTHNCVGYVWHNEWRRCWLKHRMVVPNYRPHSSVNVGVVTRISPSETTNDCKRQENKDSMGYDFKTTIYLSDEAQCCKLCRATKNCVAYVWLKPRYRCYMKYRLNNLTTLQYATYGVPY